ncbi:G2 and S phase-expressed protein 1 isoform X1 [Sphaerodactylus townsendi]|uniref:Uncharacterized protein n=1 Tax=Sphaerodactylus townsendi TaxID=933632 RepID=A0ACB8FQF0_9SAUR|nr:G2 and S phase-expressed protein 1 isoform X1 [Sphaerodactylus townsendi]XP_048358026.1 G2 and S phase-expressed protein 1 isoform X1 [Sphaerodactylus townsendi]XP_048358027.1 G2 and S phase-expressed protein 1 isoform X1 [Sphaerodactylus townsendi]
MEEGKLVVDSECKMKDSKPDECINNDFPQLSDEKFDFDLSLSPSSENEDEVFVGPMSHKEKCIAVAVEACVGAGGSIPPSSAVNLKWSPLAGEKFAEIVKEAHLVALQLQSGSKTKKKHANQVADQRPESVEKFVQESKSKLKTFETSIKTERTPRAVKRETYCVWESPISQLPHSFQKHSRQPVEEVGNLHSPLMPQKVSSPRTDKLPKSFITQVAQGCADKDVKKSSTLQTLKTSYVLGNNSLVLEQPERKSTYSPSSRRHLKSLGSLEDLLSSKSSIVPDAKVCPLVQDKRRLPTPGKLSMKTIQLKPSNDVQMRRNTLSSSSSSRSSMNSSLNSSLSISPKKGKVKTNIVAKASTCGSEVSSGTTKAAMVRSMKLSSVQASHSDLPGKQEKSTCAAKGSPSVNVAKCKADFESKISVSGIQRMSLDPRLHKSAQKMQEGRGRSCSENKMGFTTKEGMSSENGAVRVLQPIAFLSGGNVGSKVASSPPVKQLEEQTVLKSCSSIKPILTPASIKRSGLPTPVGRRMSGIPARTPKTVPRSIASPNLLPVRQASRVLSKKTSEASSKRAKESNVQAAHSSSTSSTEGDEFPPQAVAVALDFSPEKSPSHKQDLAENQKPAEETQRKEGLLVDVEIDTPPAACQECENKPLIDFFNTPEIIKTLPLKPKEKLQDLGFPLIYFSPEGNKENLDSPLIKF